MKRDSIPGITVKSIAVLKGSVLIEYMDDIQAPPVGTLGTVKGVDDIGSIMVRWDNGSSLSIVYGYDRCTIIKEEKNENS